MTRTVLSIKEDCRVGGILENGKMTISFTARLSLPFSQVDRQTTALSLFQRLAYEKCGLQLMAGQLGAAKRRCASDGSDAKQQPFVSASSAALPQTLTTSIS